MLSDFPISLCKVALLFGPIGNRILDFNDAGSPGLKDWIQAVNDPHSAGFVSAALANVHSLGHDAAKVLVTPAATVGEAFRKQQWGHLNFLSNWKKKKKHVSVEPMNIRSKKQTPPFKKIKKEWMWLKANESTYLSGRLLVKFQIKL